MSKQQTHGDDERFGRIAYEAYQEKMDLAPISYRLTWQQLTDAERRAWVHAAGCTIDVFAASVLV